MKIRRISALVASAAAGALVLSACNTPADPGDDSGGIDEGTAISVGWNQPFYEYNNNSATGNASANALVLYMMNSGFNYYDHDLNLVPDESFGTYEKLSDDPLTIQYTINDDVTWSDGQPVTAADMLLTWAATSGHSNTGEFEVDAEGATVYPAGDPLEGQPVPDDILANTVYFNYTNAGLALVSQVPEISEDGQSLTLVYDKPFADWEVNFGVGVPAHVTAMHALGIDDPQEAADALIAAVQANDSSVLAPVAEFWNSGFQLDGNLPDDESLYLSNGAYLLTAFEDSQFLTLEANPDYTGDHAAQIERVTIRYSEDPMAQVQALENGDVDVINPQSTADVLASVQALGDNFDYITQDEGTYEHVDLVFNNGGPFDPATYGGDAATALAVRQAFLKLIPRQEIIDKLIAPLNPEAAVRSSFTVIPGSPDYEAISGANGMDEQFPLETDLAGAQALLAEAGVTLPIDVRMLYGKSNVRRQQQFALIQTSVAREGLFNLIDASSDDWGALLSDSSVYDASLFGWQSTSTAVTESDANYRTGGLNNLGGYSNPEVDALYDELQIETDPARQAEIQAEVETILVNDAFGVTIFQFPGITAYNTEVAGINPIPISPVYFWNFWEWSTTATEDAS